MMEPQSTSLFSLLFLLLLPHPSLLYSLNSCTIDFDNPGKIDCDDKKLTSIPADIPKSAMYLSVFFNNILRIRQTDLTGLHRLETLNMAQNNISHIEDSAFSDLSALTELYLTFNKLTALTDDMFKGLSSLMILSFASNQIKSISMFAFETLNKLQELDLSYNKFVQISDTVLRRPLLKTLDLTGNPLTSFESADLPLSLSITNLYLNSESLRKFSIHSDVLPHLKSLLLSDISYGFEWDVSDKAFLRTVTSLSLSWTKLKLETYRFIFKSVDSVENLYLVDIGRLLDKRLLDFACDIPSLQRLYLGSNDISILNDTLLLSCINLTELDLSQNSMRDLSESSLRMLTRLTRLNIDSNELSRIPLAIRNMSTLTVLSFKSNHIREIQCSDFLNLSSLTELNLKSNQISKLSSCVFKDLQSLIILDVENNYLFQLDDSFGVSLPSLVSLNMNGNNLGWLQRGAFWNLSSLIDLHVHSMSATNIQSGAFEGLFNLKRLTFSLLFQSEGTLADLAQLESLVVFLSDDDATIVRNREPLFANLPSLQDITIKAHNLMCVDWSQFVHQDLNNLQVFSLEKICCGAPDTFRYTPHLLKLKLINCATFSPGPELFQPMTDLQSLDLSQNHLKSLDFLFEANLTKLEKLVLVNNELMIINESVFEALPSLKYLDLSGNLFACNCSNAGFIQWTINNKQVYVVSAFQYRCLSPGHFLLEFNVQSCWELTAFLCFISSSALILLTLLSSFIYHFLRWQLVYGFYLLLAFLYDSKKRRQGCPHIYDAFVSYNVHDENWVYRELLPELEGRQGWRLCLHHRDFQPGKPIIENITDAIYSSRKTLCVISRQYLQSEWCSREIQMASFRLFDEQKDVLILLFLEEISSNQLSPFYRMRKLVKSRTYLSWTQARTHKGLFWEKVRRALENGNKPEDSNPLTANV